MALLKLDNERFVSEHRLRIIVQVPDTHAQKIIDAVLVGDALAYGDYDNVAFRTAPGGCSNSDRWGLGAIEQRRWWSRCLV